MMEISFFIYFVGMMTLLVNRNHIMIVLLSFEFMYLGIFLMMILSIMFINFIKVILYLIMIVCEASLGLSMLVLMNYFYGNDKLLSMVLLKC
uniref:NADH-ubiquinone oxidoreductase chain 4L n=1 Tax=Ixodes tasmani TaxID=59654 RepID=A0A3R5W0C7_9ACAR|nr:NADH dehydrogenase subunit 4L [Ixodes tasmani]QAB05959.1 NADH dehydrogenase subunit 4L [Ixodes tasmani]QAB05972.1 NADH dehydrogenase subunit 4L [Ixodes tasmani]QAB05985.1 NADH dehydrogenase subunit 4L [Ixodes tasmani]